MIFANPIWRGDSIEKACEARLSKIRGVFLGALIEIVVAFWLLTLPAHPLELKISHYFSEPVSGDELIPSCSFMRFRLSLAFSFQSSER